MPYRNHQEALKVTGGFRLLFQLGGLILNAGGILSHMAFAKMCFRLADMNYMLDRMELPTMWIIIAALITAFSVT